jgi:hypothetical protein
VNPELHLICSDHYFGIKELRARIGVAFEENDSRLPGSSSSSSRRPPRTLLKF